MARTDGIPLVQVHKVANEVAGFFGEESEGGPIAQPSSLHGMAPTASESSLEIGLTLTIWSPKASLYENLKGATPLGDLSNWLEPTPFLYHQIRARTGAMGFARSYVNERADNKSVFHLNFSAVSSRIHEAFEMIERNVVNDPVAARDPLVRLLEIAASHILALWLFAEAGQESRVVIIDAPKRFGGVEREVFLSSEQFYAVLRRGGSISGVA
jgi:hypothetical protein